MQPADLIEKHFRLVASQRAALKKLGLATIRDLLFHFPSRYENTVESKMIIDLEKGDKQTVYGTLSRIAAKKLWRSKKPIAEGYVEDASGRIKIIWFHQPYIAKMLRDGMRAKVSGTVSGSGKNIYIANPEVEEIPGLPAPPSFGGRGGERAGPTIFPIYPESRGVTSKWFYHALKKIFAAGIHEKLDDPLPERMLRSYHLPRLRSALVWIHAPKKRQDSEAARKRFAFEEIFFIQLAKQQERQHHREKPSFVINVDRTAVGDFIKRFPFEPTRAQERAIEDILHDFETKQAMARLLEGDVGSGKTAVAAATVYAVTTTRPNGRAAGNLQTAYMVPTEILAKQHFESFIEYFAHIPIQIGLITSSGCRKFPSKIERTEATDISRAQLLKWVASGEISIVIGTHALIQKSVNFQNLAYVIIDEQHRFGTVQRQRLTRKDDIVPHLLSMTATPIPRTLALTIYGDLDLTLLDEMPKGRKEIITEIVTPSKRGEAYEKVRTEIKAGRQAYVICPRIDEPDETKVSALRVKSVKEECARLKKDVFPEYTIDILHSKQATKEKEAVMRRFLDKKTHVLVATSVIEVGVNVPNATVIVIEGAERFGLAQLHQLRGRVLRSAHQAYCFVFAETKGVRTFERLKALKTAQNGFELAERDLSLRGPGELSGGLQSGISDIGMEAIKNIKLVEAARKEARDIIAHDPELTQHSALRGTLHHRARAVHLE